MKRTLLALIMAAELLWGVDRIAEGVGPYPDVSQLLSQSSAANYQFQNLLRDNAAKSRFKTLDEKVAYELQHERKKLALKKEMELEQRDKLNPRSKNYDKLYSLIVRVYNYAKNVQGFDIPPYINPELLRAEAKAESNDDPKAIGSSGDEGLFQITLAAAKEVGITSKEFYDRNGPMFNPFDNIDVAIAIDSLIIYPNLAYNSPNFANHSRFYQQREAMQAYNGGSNRTITYEKYKLAHPNKEAALPEVTAAYFPKIKRIEAEMFPKTMAYEAFNLSGTDFRTLASYFIEPEKESFINSVRFLAGLNL